MWRSLVLMLVYFPLEASGCYSAVKKAMRQTLLQSSAASFIDCTRLCDEQDDCTAISHRDGNCVLLGAEIPNEQCSEPVEVHVKHACTTTTTVAPPTSTSTAPTTTVTPLNTKCVTTHGQRMTEECAGVRAFLKTPSSNDVAEAGGITIDPVSVDGGVTYKCPADCRALVAWRSDGFGEFFNNKNFVMQCMGDGWWMVEVPYGERILKISEGQNVFCTDKIPPRS